MPVRETSTDRGHYYHNTHFNGPALSSTRSSTVMSVDPESKVKHVTLGVRVCVCVFQAD